MLQYWLHYCTFHHSCTLIIHILNCNFLIKSKALCNNQLIDKGWPYFDYNVHVQCMSGGI